MNTELNHQSDRAVQFRRYGERLLRYVAWTVAALAFLNALYFVIRTANPVIRSDDWYFLDVFIRRVLDGTVRFGDFFVKRHGADHAQPLGKLLLVIQLQYFDLDFSIESIVGVLAAATCAMLLYRIIAESMRHDRTDTGRHFAWAAICAILFSLNSPGIWTWPLVAMQYLTFIPELLFVWAVWRSWQTGKYSMLAVITLLMGIIDDDGAIIIVVVVIAAMILTLACNTAPRNRRASLTICVVLLCMSVVRLLYAMAPLEGGAPLSPLSNYLSSLHGRLSEGGGLSWIFVPLRLSIVPEAAMYGLKPALWSHVLAGVVAVLVVSHGLFWWRALRIRHNLATFTAVCLMMLSYAWLAGILLYRVSYYGNNYLYQDRYVFLYQFNLVALLLFWAGYPEVEHERTTRFASSGYVLALLGTLMLILVQVPLSKQAWHSRRYFVAYYHQMAAQLEGLDKDPAITKGCLPELAVCTQPLPKRKELIQILASRRLNVFSPRVQDWHPFLPKFQPTGQDIPKPALVPR